MVFQRRADRNNQLYTTASGHIAAGETPEDTLSREIMEEIRRNFVS